MKPTLWFWSDHPRAARARRYFLVATGIFVFFAVYLVLSTIYLDSHNGVGSAVILNQVGAFIVAALVLALVLHKGFREVAAAYGQIGKIVEHMSDYFHMVDKDWKYTFVNRKLATLLQHEPKDLIGKSLWDFVPTSLQPDLRQQYEEVVRTGRPLRVEYHTKETGVWTEIQAYPDEDGLAVFFQDISERKRSEALLHERKQSVKAVVESAMDGVVSLDTHQNIILFNHAAETMFQVTSEDIMGKPVTTLMPERFRKTHGEHVHTFGHTSTTTRRMGALGEVYGLRADGTEFPMEVSISQTGSEDAHVYTAIIRDITEKKRARQLLDQKIRQQVALAQFSMASLGSQNPVELFSSAARQAQEQLDADYCTIVDVDNAKETARIVVTAGWQPESTPPVALKSLRADALVPRLLRSRGITRFSDIDQDPSLSHDDVLSRLGVKSGMGLALQSTNDHVGMIFVLSKTPRAFSQDDAEFLQTLSNIVVRARESDLALTTLRLRDRALESISQGITISDEAAEGRPIIYTNTAFARMTGYKVKDILGLPVQHFLAADAPPGIQDQFALIRAKRRSVSLDTRTRKRDGSSFTDHVAVSPIVNSDNELIHYVAVHEDVTEARQRDEQLHESQKMEAVGQLTGGVAHDFNNLLTVVRANAEDMRKDFKDQPILLEQLDMILQASDRGAALIRQMMAFARKQELDPQSIDINAMLGPFIKLARRTLQENIMIEVKYGSDVPAIHVDPGRLETAILNMILNARDAMPDGGTITIETSVKQLDKGYAQRNADARAGTYVLLAISDTGTGMSKETAEKAFQPFFTTKEVGQGTGLGLSMVYGFLRQSGGHAKIYSELGIGTSVKVYLPLAPEAVVAIPVKAAVAATNTQPASGSILVVEDDDLVRKSVSDRLKRMGYTITTADNAAAALASLENNSQIDLVFTDVIMPGVMTGADLAREIRQRWPDIQILMTSGYTAFTALGKVKMPEGIPLLTKPYTVEQLTEALTGILGKRKS